MSKLLQKQMGLCVQAAPDAGPVNTSKQDQPRVLICGAGVIGSAIAYFLSLRGVNATVVERTGVACAASGILITILTLSRLSCNLHTEHFS